MKKFLTVLISFAIMTSCLGLFGCDNKGEEVENILSKDLPTTTSVIEIEAFKDKVKGALAGQMVGVSYAYPVEFKYKYWIPEFSLPSWTPTMINEGFNQDDIYLAISGIEALNNHGLNVTSRELGIDMYNRDFEYWNGSNNDVLARGYAPPYAGYPKYSTDGNLTTWFPDGNSYQCGGALAGLFGLNMRGVTNEISNRYAEICTYGDGIYGMQFIAAMYGAAMFTNDVMEVVNAGLSVVPEDSWTKMVLDDTIKNYKDGKTAQENYVFLHDKYIVSEEYNWIPWPSGGILLDAKMCNAFTVMGLLYGEKDMNKSMRVSMQCAHDTDSTTAAVGGILSAMSGYSKMDTKWTSALNDKLMFKYTNLTIEKTVDTCVELAKQEVVKNGGKVVNVDGKLSFVIPESAKAVEVGKYKNSKYPEKMEVATYSEAEMDKMRILSDPGFERHYSNVTNNWQTKSSGLTKAERMTGTAYTGICNIIIKGSLGWQDIFQTVEVKKNTAYQITCMVKTNADFSSKIKLFASNKNDVSIRELTFDKMGEWTKISISVNSGANELMKIGVGFEKGTASDWLRVDDFTIFKK